MLFTLIRDGFGDADRSALSAHYSEGEMYLCRGVGSLVRPVVIPSIQVTISAMLTVGSCKLVLKNKLFCFLLVWFPPRLCE